MDAAWRWRGRRRLHVGDRDRAHSQYDGDGNRHQDARYMVKFVKHLLFETACAQNDAGPSPTVRCQAADTRSTAPPTQRSVEGNAGSRRRAHAGQHGYNQSAGGVSST